MQKQYNVHTLFIFFINAHIEMVGLLPKNQLSDIFNFKNLVFEYRNCNYVSFLSFSFCLTNLSQKQKQQCLLFLPNNQYRQQSYRGQHKEIICFRLHTGYENTFQYKHSRDAEVYCEDLNCGSWVNSLVCLINKSMFQTLSMSGSLYQAQTLPPPPPPLGFFLMWIWDTVVIITCIVNEIQKQGRVKEKNNLFSLVTQIGCSPKGQNTLTTGKSMKFFSSLMSCRGRTGLLYLKTYFAVKIIPSGLQYLMAVF